MFRTIAAAVALVVGLAGHAAASDDDAVAVSSSSIAAAAMAAAAPIAAEIDWTSRPMASIANRPGVLPVLYVSLAGLQAYDGYSTLTGVRRGAGETNGLMKNVAGNPAAMWAVKGGVTAASIVLSERLWKQNRKVAAIVTMVATNGLMAAVAARNASVLHTLR